MATVDCNAREQREDRLIARALRVMEKRIEIGRATDCEPDRVRSYLRTLLHGLEREEIWAIWLDAQNRVIDAERLFFGSLTECPAWAREIVMRALAHNAAGVFIAHNHPSGNVTPSDAERDVTFAVKRLLALLDVKLLDHFIVGEDAEPVSFAECGWL